MIVVAFVLALVQLAWTVLEPSRQITRLQLSVKTLAQLFDSLLDISKIESGAIKPNVVAFPLMPLIDKAVEAGWPIAAQKKLDLRVVRTSVSGGTLASNCRR